MSWHKVLSQSDLGEGERRVVKVDGRSLLLLRHQGQLFAVENACPHLRLPLKGGRIAPDGALVCPFHRSAFDLVTGDVKEWSPWPPAVGRMLGVVSREKALPVYAIKEEDGGIWVDLPAAETTQTARRS